MDYFTMGMDIAFWRLLTGIGAFCVVLLYMYRVLCLVSLMKLDSAALPDNSRLVYAGLIVFLPLGIGGWIYDFVVNKRTMPLLFVVPFLSVALVAIHSFSYTLLHTNNFNFDFLGF